jgi:general secretion pathway protein G
MRRLIAQSGFTLIELVMIILIIGIIATITVRKMGETIQTAQMEQTKKEMEQLARAIVGNSDVYARGSRVDFGYVGDIGALPPNLDALAANPGGYATWHGPYIDGNFGDSAYKKDAWGVPYTYAGTVIRSTGSGSIIDKTVSSSVQTLLNNTVRGYVVDADREAPPGTYRDSVAVVLAYPDGLGGTAVVSQHPQDDGRFAIGNVPVGNHELRVIYSPRSDTVSFPVTIYPGKDVTMDIIFPADLW